MAASLNFPIIHAYQPSYGGGVYDAYVTKFSPDGQTLEYSTFVGGNDYEQAYAIASALGNVEVRDLIVHFCAPPTPTMDI